VTTITKPIILFDVDKTLIDTPKLFAEKVVTTLLNILDLYKEEYQFRNDAYQQTLHKYTDFEPIGYLQYISQQQDVTALANATVYNPEFHKQSVFPDALPTLTKLQTTYQLGIFSEANLSWQQKKLELSEIKQFIEPDLTFIWRRKTDPEQLKSLPTGVTIIDDNEEVIGELTQVSTITPIWLNRLSNAQLASTATIHNLYELSTILTTNHTQDTHE
jgi:phosphoglycolate phosphatase-like HAD superfamily hydrolase